MRWLVSVGNLWEKQCKIPPHLWAIICSCLSSCKREPEEFCLTVQKGTCSNDRQSDLSWRSQRCNCNNPWACVGWVRMEQRHGKEKQTDLVNQRWFMRPKEVNCMAGASVVLVLVIVGILVALLVVARVEQLASQWWWVYKLAVLERSDASIKF